jgi:hypothetical protein
MKTIFIKDAFEHRTASDAIQWMYADGRGEAIYVGGRYVTAPKAECDRLAAEGVSFAYLHDHELPDGRHTIVTIPVN